AGRARPPPAHRPARAAPRLPGPRARLRITKASVPANASPAAGAELTYTVTATNGGPSIATTTVVSDSVPAGTTFARSITPTGWSCTTPPVNGGGDLSCTNASMMAGQTATFTVVVRPLSSTP